MRQFPLNIVSNGLNGASYVSKTKSQGLKQLKTSGSFRVSA